MIPTTYFLNLVKEKGKSPNFWMSEEYIKLSGLKWVDSNGLQGYEQDGIWFFPKYLSNVCCFSYDECITGFQGEWNEKFWDYEFIYDPKNFLDLSGKKWKVFRKNIKKHQNKSWKYRRIREDDEYQITELFLKWGKDRTLYDIEVFAKFVMFGKNRFGLFLEGELKGVNIADTNFKYINYRICFDNGEDFLNEFLRWKFYTSEWVLNQNKLVNDGGCLGSEGLEKFKNKLNPVFIMNIYTGVK